MEQFLTWLVYTIAFLETMASVWLTSIDSACVVVSKKVEPATEPCIHGCILLLPLIVLSDKPSSMSFVWNRISIAAPAPRLVRVSLFFSTEKRNCNKLSTQRHGKTNGVELSTLHTTNMLISKSSDTTVEIFFWTRPILSHDILSYILPDISYNMSGPSISSGHTEVAGKKDTEAKGKSFNNRTE